MNERRSYETRPWRTLFQVIYIWRNPENEIREVWVLIPGWDSNLAVRIEPEQITPDILATLTVGHRYYGRACIGAETYDGLNIFINEAPAKQYTDEERAKNEYYLGGVQWKIKEQKPE